MGCFDIVRVPCPECGLEAEFQSKGGDRSMSTYDLNSCPEDVLSDVNRHSPHTCRKCGCKFDVEVAQSRKVEPG